MLRNDFVSNSSSSSFILLKNEYDGIFEKHNYKPDNLTWKEYCQNCIQFDYEYFLRWGYDCYERYIYDENYKQTGVRKLCDIIKYTETDDEFINKWLISGPDIIYYYPPSCKDVCDKIIKIIDDYCDKQDDLRSGKYDKDECKKIYEEIRNSKDTLNKYFDELGEIYKKILNDKCKDLEFVICSVSDHSAGWDGMDDAESAMENDVMNNSKTVFKRILNGH